MAGYIGKAQSVSLTSGYTSAEADAEFVNDPNEVITVSGSNVGIGETSPSAPLTITAATADADGALGSQSPQFTINGGNTNNPLEIGMDNSGATAVGFIQSRNTISGTQFLSLNPNGGNVGIGTSSPTNTLHVDGTLKVEGSVGTISTDSQGLTLDLNRAGTTGVVNNNASGILTFGTATSERMRIDSAGRVTMPYQPSFAYVPSSQTSATSESPIDFQTATISSVDFNSSLSRFTAPVAGKYLIQVSIALYLSGDCRQITLNLLKNGSIYRSSDTFIQQTQGNNTHTMAEVTVVIDLNANDYINAQWETYPSTTITRYVSNKRCMFQGYLIG